MTDIRSTAPAREVGAASSKNLSLIRESSSSDVLPGACDGAEGDS